LTAFMIRSVWVVEKFIDKKALNLRKINISEMIFIWEYRPEWMAAS
jgi:hypothetical protein